jgi:hypothetical protein
MPSHPKYGMKRRGRREKRRREEERKGERERNPITYSYPRMS